MTIAFYLCAVTIQLAYPPFIYQLVHIYFPKYTQRIFRYYYALSGMLLRERIHFYVVLLEGFSPQSSQPVLWFEPSLGFIFGISRLAIQGPFFFFFFFKGRQIFFSSKKKKKGPGKELIPNSGRR